MNWLRLHHSMLDSVKVQNLPLNQFKAWVNLMVIASENDPRGTLPDIDQIAFRLRLRRDQASTSVLALVNQGLIEPIEGGYQMHDWHDWQKDSDDINQRVKKYREAKCNVTRNVTVTPQIEIRIDKTREEPPIPPKDAFKSARHKQCFEQFWEAYPKKRMKAQAAKEFARYILTEKTFTEAMEGLRRGCGLGSEMQFHPDPPRWIKNSRWLDAVVPPAKKNGIDWERWVETGEMQ